MFTCNKSDLVILNIASIKHSLDTIIPQTDDERVCFYDHIINLNFDRQDNIDKSNMFRIVLEVHILPPDNKPGYDIECVIHGYFEITAEQEFDDDDLLHKYDNTALAMIINYLRAHLRNITHEGIYGAYTMPSVDFIDILNKKNKQNRSQQN